ncbi:competence protein ComGC [Companilactobacillus sp. RD055328]|uniref:competence type IV pilus major pilin ComGC n=1 Tax=Companilactobacillus sp. RD055328 TaxID=2916634 RepID=UPI001FC819DD|nr:competence type IV pilus major pilin ComGC [Companilactobacillus sp. RD055328]GKQ42992.1 competence protein ComGC [Companilactobacillus sp. RD055328]
MKKIKHKGFTLIEMVFVIFIITLLLLIVIPNLASQKEHATNKTDEAFITTLQGQVDLYEGETPTLKGLATSHYISDKQLKHAEEKGITIHDGIVEKGK